MICSRLLTTALIFVGSFTFAPKTMAQTVDVPFTGTIGGACTFGQVTPGTIKPSQTLNDIAFMPDVPGKVNVTCNTPVHVTASLPSQIGGPAYAASGYQTDITIPGSNHYYGENTQMPLPNGSTPIEVSMWVRKGTANLSPGVYSYKVTLTIIP